MYTDFRTNLAIAILTSDVVNILFQNDEEIKIGIGGHSAEELEYYPFGFAIKKDSGAYFWYSYSSIIKIEVY